MDSLAIVIREIHTARHTVAPATEGPLSNHRRHLLPPYQLQLLEGPTGASPHLEQ